MDLKNAQKIADAVIERINPYCFKIQVAGSIRRKKEFPKDIDIVLIPSDAWNLEHEMMGLQFSSVTPSLKPISGEKLRRISYNGIQLDFYFATPETWATLLLIRTGSKENNIRLCSIAKRRGWRLAANGNGLFNYDGFRIAGDSERSIYEALDVPWQEPEERG